MSPQLTISVKEARKLLGNEAKTMPDSLIVELIQNLTDMSVDFLQDLGSINTIGVSNDT